MHKALRLSLGLLLLCCLAMAQTAFRACQVSTTDLLLLTSKGKFLLHNGGVSWDISDPKDAEAFKAWRLSLKGKPDVSEIVDAVQKGKLGTQVPFAGEVKTTVQGDATTIELANGKAIHLSSGRPVASDVAVVATALKTTPEALTKNLAAGDWANFVKVATQKDAHYVSLGEKPGVVRVEKAKIIPPAPKPKPVPPALWTQTWFIVSAVVVLLLIVGAIVVRVAHIDIFGGLSKLPGFLKSETTTKKKDTKQKVTPTELELLAFFREQAAGEDPSDLLDELRNRYHKFPTLRKDLGAETKKADALEERVKALRRYEKFSTDADAAFKQYDDLQSRYKSLQEQNAQLNQARLQMEKNLEGMESEAKRLDGLVKAKDRQLAGQKQAIEGLQGKLRDETEVYRREAEALRRLRALIDESGTVV